MDMTTEEIRNVLRRGSGFHQGKFRIMRMFEQMTDEKELAKAVAKEYGIGGHSHEYLCGERGFVDYDAKGIRLSWHGYSESVTIGWVKAVRIIRWMIDNNDYLTGKEPEQYAAWWAEMHSADSHHPVADDYRDDDVSATDDDGEDDSAETGGEDAGPEYEQMTFDDIMGGW